MNRAQSSANVLVVANDNSPISRSIAEYYAHQRTMPSSNVCHIRASTHEDIDRAAYDRDIAAPIGVFLKKNLLVQSIFYIVTTSGVPLRIEGTSGLGGNAASVDSELAALYFGLTQGKPHRVDGSLENPFYGRNQWAFRHPEFPMCLVTRLAAYDEQSAKGIVDLSLRAVNQGKFVIDLSSRDDHPGNNWLRTAAVLLPKDRVIVDDSPQVLYNQTDAIGYASWGSNDQHRHRRFLGFHWLPGAIMTEYVSTNGRTFERPPENWDISNWQSRELGFHGSPQTLTADYILEGATGASGHVYEPYLAMTPRPELSWQNIVVGDPLCSLGRP